MNCLHSCGCFLCGETQYCVSDECKNEVKMQNPDSWIEAALEELRDTLASKNEDYRIGGEFSNFEFAADLVGGELDPQTVMLTQIAIKLGRIKGLEADMNFSFESYADTIKDLAGYAVIMYAYLRKTGQA